MKVNQEIVDVYEDIENLYTDFSSKYTEFDETSLDKGLMSLASNYAFIGAVLAYARYYKDTQEAEVESLEYTIRKQANDELTRLGQRATQHAVDTMTFSNDSLRLKREQVIQADLRYNLCKNLLGSISHLKDMLVQISSNRRSEVKLHN